MDPALLPVMRERLVYLCACLVGLTVRVHVKGGKIYEGIMSAAKTSEDLSIKLKMARLFDPKNPDRRLSRKDIIGEMVIEPSDFISLSAVDVDMSFAEKGVLADRSSFKTDTAISGHGGNVMERELEKWSPDADDASMALDWNTDKAKSWNQFEVNEKLFGVKTDYKEELYTTKLDKNSAEYKQRERDAQRLAAEIEAEASGNVHLAEERGQEIVDDSQMDEEDRYGAVVRNQPSQMAMRSSPKLTVPVKPNEETSSQRKKTFAEMAKEKTAAAEKSKQQPQMPFKETEKPKPAAFVKTEKKGATKLSLNPNASEFKFNIGASEFTPFAPAAEPVEQETVQMTEPDEFFGKSVPVMGTSILGLFYANVNPEQLRQEAKTSDSTWPMTSYAAQMAFMPMQYPFAAPAGYPPQQFQQYAAPPNMYMPVMPMMPGYGGYAYAPTMPVRPQFSQQDTGRKP